MDFKNKAFYEGNFDHNQFHGEGKYKWQDYSIYEGDWIDNMRKGYGVMSWRNKR